jgi:hypothetical protein
MRKKKKEQQQQKGRKSDGVVTFLLLFFSYTLFSFSALYFFHTTNYHRCYTFSLFPLCAFFSLSLSLSLSLRLRERAARGENGVM